MSSPAQRTAEAPPRPGAARSIGAAVGQWRNLNLPVKLAMVMLVPVIVSLILGIAVINGQLANADQFARANRITELSGSVRAAVTALQAERQQVGTPTAAAPPAGPVRARTDAAVGLTRGAVRADSAAGDLDPVAGAAWSSADRQLGELGAIRSQDSARPANRSTEVGAYTQLVDALLAFDRVLTTGVGDAQLSRQALGLYDLFAAREEVLYQQAIVLTGIGRGTMSVPDVTSLHGSEARLASRISDFRAVSSEDGARDFARAVSGAALAQQGALLGQAIDQSGGMSGMPAPGMMIMLTVPVWNATNDPVTAGLTAVTDDLGRQLLADSTALRDDASSAAGTASVALAVALIVGIAMMVVVARQLLRSIGVLRRTARDVAARQLPDAVERIRAGETVDAVVRPVGVHTTDEVGELARAFDAVHAEALRLAVEQATLRANYSELFMNLSRRSQSLVQRQLRLIEQLERDEEDPDQLGALFKLDHLATRMRRNNENLMVLSGSELGRGPSQPVTLADLLRAGVSEIEHYQRVVVQPPPDAHIAGYAAGDLVRLLAELLDNATAFSAPETPVTVASHRTKRAAIVIDIVDHGIGMNDEELARANEQLSRPAGVEGRMSRRMGLFVISRLANQHGVRVRLHGGQDIPGMRVTITVPAELVLGNDPLPTAGRGGTPTGPDGQLPRRVRGATAIGGPGQNGPGGTGPTGGGPNGGGQNGGGQNGFAHHGARNGVAHSGANGNGANGNGANGNGANGNGANGNGNGGNGIANGAANGTVNGAAYGFADYTVRGLSEGGFHGTVAGVSTGLLDERANGGDQNGGYQNGSVANGTQPNGLANGTQPNGLANGTHPNGLANGTQPNGLANGTHPNGLANGTHPSGTANGTAANGLANGDYATGEDAVAAAMTVTIPALPSATSSGVGLFAPLPGDEDAPGGGEAAAAHAPDVTPIFDDMLSAWFAAEPQEQAAGAGTGDGEGDGGAAPAGGWRFAADEGWRAVDAIAGTTASEFTSVGLPKRQPKALLLPGSVTGAAEPGEQAAGPSAERLRDRLAGFQRGVLRGRELTGTDVPLDAPRNPVFEAAPEPAPAPAPAPAAAPVPEPAPEPVPAAFAEPVAVTEIPDATAWSSSADEGWRAADAAADAAPGEYTQAGLPRRQPKAQLLPGSVAGPARTGAHATGTHSRDASALRDRLSSFQRGLRQGRGTAAEADDRVEQGFQW